MFSLPTTTKIMLGLLFFCILLLVFNHFLLQQQDQKKSTKSLNVDVSSFEKSDNQMQTAKLKKYQSFVFTRDHSHWQVMQNKTHHFSIAYPPEVTFSQPDANLEFYRFTVGLENKKNTIMTIGINNNKAKATPSSVQTYSGVDLDNNKIITVDYPSGNDTVRFIGTVYPNTGGKFEYESLIIEMIKTITFEDK